MKFNTKIVFSVIILSLFSLVNNSFGQKDRNADKFGFYFVGKYQNSAKIPFEMYANLIVIKLQLDNSDTLNFILDTGVSSVIITDPEKASIFNLKYVRKVKINGAGSEKFIEASISVGHKIDLGFVEAQNQNIVVLDQDILKLSEYMGIPIHGIFGHELFSRFVVTIDFGSKVIYLKEPSKFKFRKRHGEKYPIEVTSSKPYIYATELAQNNDNYKPVRLVIDTGAGHALLLNAQENSPITLPDKVIRANLGRGLNGNINGNIGRISKFKIGKYEFKNVLASFPDSLSFSIKFNESDDNRQGSIGGEFLRRFVVTFNYRDSYIALKPLKSKYKETFEHDMSGLEIRAKGEFFDEFFISFVTPDSQAEKAGLKEGDQIIFFNNKHFKELNINEIYKMLSKKEGADIEFFVRRNGDLQFFYFKLRRVI